MCCGSKVEITRKKITDTFYAVSEGMLYPVRLYLTATLTRVNRGYAGDS